MLNSLPELATLDGAQIPKRSAARMRIEQWTPGISVTWSPSDLRQAVADNRRGLFSRSSQLAESMLADDEYTSSLNRAIDEVLSSPFSLMPETEDGDPISISELIAEQLGAQWGKCITEEAMASILGWYLGIGAAVATIDWDKEWRPYLRVLHPQFMWWDSELLNARGQLGAMMYQTRNGAVEITPGDGKWFLMGSRESWASCAVAAIGENWFVKRCAWRDWQRYNERHGLPIIKAFVPSSAEAQDKRSFIRDVSRVGSDTTVGLPTHLGPDGEQFDLDLLEAKDQSFDSFEKTLARCDRKIQIFFLGSNVGSETTSVGSRAASEASADVTKRIASSRARRFGTYLRDQLVTPWALWTVPGATLDAMPWPSWQVIAGLEESTSIRWGAVADAIAKWSTAGYDVKNAIDIAAELGLTVEEKPAPEPGAIDPKTGLPVPPLMVPAEPGMPAESVPAESVPAEEEALTAGGLDFGQVLGRHRRIAIVGGPRVGKTTLSKRVSDRKVVSTDDFIRQPWGSVPTLIQGAVALESAFIVEGVQAARFLRKGGQVDAVIRLDRPKVPRTKGQETMAKSVNKIFDEWASGNRSTPVYLEHETSMGPRFRRA